MHHVVVSIVSSIVYYYQAFQYFAPAFMGVAEISSIPLALMDVFKMFPALRKHFPNTNEVSRNLFAASFLACRGVYWPLTAYRFVESARAAMASGAPLGLPEPAMYVLLLCNVLMVGLQWYWSYLILKAIFQKLTGDERLKDA